MKVDLYEVLLTIINAIDLINPILKRHHSRTAVLAYYIGVEHGIEGQALAELLIAALLHDIGALTVTDANALVELDVKNPEAHAKLGAGMLSAFAPFEHICDIISNHHVRYDERSNDTGEITIPVASYILHLADRIEILTEKSDIALNQKDRISEIINGLNGSLFAPWVVDCFNRVKEREEVWYDFDYLTSHDVLSKIDQKSVSALMEQGSIDDLVYTLSKIVDYKCQFTASHSSGVAAVSYLLAKLCDLDEPVCQSIKIAGFLHDIGKIAVPSELLFKNGKLTKEEYNVVKSHPYFTREILKRVRGLEDIVYWASSHHERKDQMGYPSKPKTDLMGIEIEVISYADVFTALCEKRPYRDQLGLDEVLEIIEVRFADVLGSKVLPVLKAHAKELHEELIATQKRSETEYKCSVVE